MNERRKNSLLEHVREVKKIQMQQAKYDRINDEIAVKGFEPFAKKLDNLYAQHNYYAHDEEGKEARKKILALLQLLHDAGEHNE